MHKELEVICESLDRLSSSILNSSGDDRTLAEMHGWHHPPITRTDIAAIPADLASRIRIANVGSIDSNITEKLKDVPRRLAILQNSTIPYIFNGNANQALPAFMTTLEWLSSLLMPSVGWLRMPDDRSLPAPMARKLRRIQSEIDELSPSRDRLQAQIRQIQEVAEAAESLPSDLQSLKEARGTIYRLSTEAAELYGKIDERYVDAYESIKIITEREKEADRLVQQCEEAYRITTTKGLAAAFDQRAGRLGLSMWVWVGGLLIALIIGAFLGSNRIELLSTAIADRDPHWGVIWMHIALSLLSVGAPLWFAWISTKQISQRFRLAEDYGFKASVAKAYEGYKREAARIDESFEARLFSSALSRLEEAPLRLLDGKDHGSPWHELVSSEAFNKAISAVPELKDKFVQITKDSIAQAGKIGKKSVDD